ncbi:MAG: hypothetical protein ACLQVN_02200 [Bryobacteraceae bacterium]
MIAVITKIAVVKRSMRSATCSLLRATRASIEVMRFWGDGANVGLGLFGEDDPLHAGSLGPRTCSIVKPSSATTSSNGMPELLRNHSLEAATARSSSSVTGSSSMGALRIEAVAVVGHNFEQPDHGVELARIELVEQLMGMLFVHAVFLQ